MEIASRVKGINYAIRDLDTGKKIKNLIKLNIGDPAIFDFVMPKAIIKAISTATKENKNYYTESEGIFELRSAIAKKVAKQGISVSPENIIITGGTSEAVNLLFACLVQKGKEILLPSPTYPQYSSLVKFFEGKPVYYSCDENNNWQPDINDIKKKISKKTRAIVIINPNNPTGAVYKKSTLKKIINLAVSRNIPIISDEIYDEITYESCAVPCASLSKDAEIITLNGMSKNYLAPGWRIGWIMLSNFKNTELKEALLKLCRLRLCVNSPAQFAIAKTLHRSNHTSEIRKKLKQRRDFVLERIERLNKISPLLKFSCTKPEGAFYAFPKIEDKKNIWKNDLDFVKDVRNNAHVLLVHGTGFDYSIKDSRIKHFRIVFLPPIKTLNTAFNRIEEFLRKKVNKLK